MTRQIYRGKDPERDDIEVEFDPTRPESAVFYRYPDGSNEWIHCPFQGVDLRGYTDEAICREVGSWVCNCRGD